MTHRLAVILLGACCLSGCAASATQVGQTAGGILGSLLVPGVGTGLGSLVGTVAGLVVDDQLDKAREKKERVDLSHELKPHPSDGAVVAQRDEPVGRSARVWVDEALVNGTLMAGHFAERVIR